MSLRDDVSAHGAALVLTASIALAGCAGVGIVETSDPYAKLAQAGHLLNDSGRVMQARRQLDEAIGIFEIRGEHITEMTAFHDPELFSAFGLPLVLSQSGAD